MLFIGMFRLKSGMIVEGKNGKNWKGKKSRKKEEKPALIKAVN